MARAKTTKMLFNDGEFFVSLTDMPGVCVGMSWGTRFDVPRGHAYYDRIAEATTRQEVEGYFDELMDAFA